MRLDAALPVGRAGGLARGRLVGTARGGLRLRHHINWRVEGTEASPEGTIGWPNRRRPRRCATPRRDDRRQMGDADLGHDVVPARLHRRDGAAAVRGEDGNAAGALGRRQRQDDGAGRGRLSLDRREAASVKLSEFGILNRSREDTTMMQVGIFTGYFPYGLKETAQKIRRSASTPCSSTCTFKDIDFSAGQITKDKAKTVRDSLPRPQPADLLRLRLHQHHPSRQGRAQAARRLSQGDHPQRPRISARPT